MGTCFSCPSPAVEGEDLCRPCLTRWAKENGVDLVRRALFRENEQLRAENEQLRAENERLRAENKRLREHVVTLTDQGADGAAWLLVQGVAPEEYWENAGTRSCGPVD